MKKYPLGMVFGTFDLFHPGHEFYIRSAKKFCKNLIVIVARDSRVLSGKGFLPNNNEEIRHNTINRFLRKNFIKKSEYTTAIQKFFQKKYKNISKFHPKQQNRIHQKIREIQDIISLKFFHTEENKTFAILGDEENIFAPIEFFSPDILFFGYDQKVPENILQEKFPKIITKRIASFSPEKYKSSILRKKI